MSCSSRSLLLCTIWLIANGAAGWSGWPRSQAASVSVISASHSSSCAAGRALSAGIEPTMPALHCAMTSLGLLMMNSGAPMIGSGRLCRTGGSGMTGFRCASATPCDQKASSASAGDALGAVDDAVAHARAPCSGGARRRSARWRSWRCMNAASPSPAASRSSATSSARASCQPAIRLPASIR